MRNLVVCVGLLIQCGTTGAYAADSKPDLGVARIIHNFSEACDRLLTEVPRRIDAGYFGLIDSVVIRIHSGIGWARSGNVEFVARRNGRELARQGLNESLTSLLNTPRVPLDLLAAARGLADRMDYDLHVISLPTYLFTEFDSSYREFEAGTIVLTNKSTRRVAGFFTNPSLRSE